MNKYNLNGKVAIVTGGAQGFGLAITKRIISSGGKVVIWDIDKDEAEKAKKEINSENFSYQIVDVTDFEMIKRSITGLEQKLSQIDIFVNNAGMTGMNAKVWDYPLDEWQRVIELNCN